MTYAEALDGKFLPDLDEEQRKDELHQWYVLCCHMYILSYTCICWYMHIYI